MGRRREVVMTRVPVHCNTYMVCRGSGFDKRGRAWIVWYCTVCGYVYIWRE